jgi:hypothetical protein
MVVFDFIPLLQGSFLFVCQIPWLLDQGCLTVKGGHSILNIVCSTHHPDRLVSARTPGPLNSEGRRRHQRGRLVRLWPFYCDCHHSGIVLVAVCVVHDMPNCRALARYHQILCSVQCYLACLKLLIQLFIYHLIDERALTSTNPRRLHTTLLGSRRLRRST